MDRGFRELASARFAQSWSRSQLDRRICLGALEHIMFDITEVTFAILQNIETDRPPEKVQLRYGRHQRIPIAVGKLDAIPTPEGFDQFVHAQSITRRDNDSSLKASVRDRRLSWCAKKDCKDFSNMISLPSIYICSTPMRTILKRMYFLIFILALYIRAVEYGL